MIFRQKSELYCYISLNYYYNLSMLVRANHLGQDTMVKMRILIYNGFSKYFINMEMKNSS